MVVLPIILFAILFINTAKTQPEKKLLTSFDTRPAIVTRHDLSALSGAAPLSGGMAEWAMLPLRIVTDPISSDEDAYVVFDLKHQGGSSVSQYSTSYLAITECASGRIVSFFPTGSTHYMGLKMIAIDEVLLASNVDDLTQGPSIVWRWKTNEMVQVAGGYADDSHDVELFEGLIWRLSGDRVVARNMSTGDVIHVVDINQIGASTSNNYAQPYRREDQRLKVLVSNKDNSQFGQFDVHDNVLDWLMTNVSQGQHNVEYMGDGEFYLFDNGCAVPGCLASKATRPSRLLVLDDAGKERWSYDVDRLPQGFTPNFGDHDRLPDGSSLATAWSGYAQPGLPHATIFRVDRTNNRLNWMLKVMADDPLPIGDRLNGWKIYNAELFYTRPRVYDLHCRLPSLSFTTAPAFKSHEPIPFDYEIFADGRLHARHSEFWAAHWRPTTVLVNELPSDTSVRHWRLRVSNPRHGSTELEVDCAHQSPTPVSA